MDHQNQGKSNEITGVCPVCHTIYSGSEAELIRDTAQATLAYALCAGCGEQFLVLQMYRDSFATTVGVRTELQRHEVERMIAYPAISADDVIGLHQALTTRTAIDNFYQRVNK